MKITGIELPEIIEYKKFENDLTKEQQIFNKVISKQLIDENEEKILDELIDFYSNTTELLPKIDLKDISSEEYDELVEFLKQFYNVMYPVQNKLDFKKLYRVCIVNDSLREKGKIRHPKFISFPELKHLKSRGKLNRANTANTTILYASSILNVAIAEVKPKAGDTIIISHWEKSEGGMLNSYPIINCEEEIANDFLKKSAQAFKQLYSETHEKFAKIIDINLKFLATEFIKDVNGLSERGYEYAISSFYSDGIIDLKEFDCIIYPSVPFNYDADNVAIKPDDIEDYVNITKGIKLSLLEEYKVESIDYTKIDLTEEFYSLKLIRDSDWIEPDDILWSDD